MLGGHQNSPAFGERHNELGNPRAVATIEPSGKLIPSEFKTQCELDLALLLGGNDLAEVARAQSCGYAAEVRMVPDVKKLRPELKLVFFLNGEALEESPIPRLLPWPSDETIAAVPEETPGWG